MPTYTVHALGVSQISVSGGQQLSGFTQGDGSHLVGETITLNSNAWQAVQIDDSETNFDDSDNSQSLTGPQSFDGTSYSGSERVEAEYHLLLQDPDGNTYEVLGFNVNEADSGHPAYGTVEGLAFVGGTGGFPPVNVPLTVLSASEGPSEPYADLAAPPCFTPGTLIETLAGEVPIEELRVGDQILTLDAGYQPIRWIGQRIMRAAELRANPRFRPVRIRAGALGSGLPETDLTVSRQHRVLVRSVIAERMFDVPEVLVPAIKLLAVNGVELVQEPRRVAYWHILFDTHQIVWSNGLPTESLFVGREALKAVSSEARAEIIALFPKLAEPWFQPIPARPLPETGKRVSQLVERHVRNDKPLIDLRRSWNPASGHQQDGAHGR